MVGNQLPLLTKNGPRSGGPTGKRPKRQGACRPAPIIASTTPHSSSRADIKTVVSRHNFGNQGPWGQLFQANGYIALFLKETISMRPFSSSVFCSAAPRISDEDLDATVSFSSSEDEQPDPPALQLLARALLSWQPALVAHYARLGHAPGDLAPFSAFLGRLEREVAGQAAMRGEIIGWLQGLAADEPARTRVFRMASGTPGAGSALALYQAMRRPDE
jgi:hypothetical protein